MFQLSQKDVECFELLSQKDVELQLKDEQLVQKDEQYMFALSNFQTMHKWFLFQIIVDKCSILVKSSPETSSFRDGNPTINGRPKPRP